MDIFRVTYVMSLNVNGMRQMPWIPIKNCSTSFSAIIANMKQQQKKVWTFTREPSTKKVLSFKLSMKHLHVKNAGMYLAPFIPSPAVSLIWSCVEDYHWVAWYTDTGMATMMYGVMTRQRSHFILQPVTLYLGAPGEKFSARSLTGPGCYSTPG